MTSQRITQRNIHTIDFKNLSLDDRLTVSFVQLKSIPEVAQAVNNAWLASQADHEALELVQSKSLHLSIMKGQPPSETPLFDVAFKVCQKKPPKLAKGRAPGEETVRILALEPGQSIQVDLGDRDPISYRNRISGLAKKKNILLSVSIPGNTKIATVTRYTGNQDRPEGAKRGASVGQESEIMIALAPGESMRIFPKGRTEMAIRNKVRYIALTRPGRKFSVKRDHRDPEAWRITRIDGEPQTQPEPLVQPLPQVAGDFDDFEESSF